MPVAKKNRKSIQRKLLGKSYGIIDPNIRSHANDPFFVKKAEEAKEILRQSPPPERIGKPKIK